MLFETAAFDQGNPGITVHGDINPNAIYGTSGTDSITGNGGDDFLIGGDGDDTFFFSANAGEGSDVLSDFNVGDGGDVGGDILAFTDLLDLDPTGFDQQDVDLFTGSVKFTFVNDEHDLELSVPGAVSDTTITLAGVGDDYASSSLNDGQQHSLTELINTLDDNGNHINVDTYAS